MSAPVWIDDNAVSGGNVVEAFYVNGLAGSVYGNNAAGLDCIGRCVRLAVCVKFSCTHAGEFSVYHGGK